MGVQSNAQTTSVLIVGDDHDTASFLESSLSTLGFEISLASSGIEALEQLRARHFDVIISEFAMPKMSGKDLYAEVEKHFPWATENFCFIVADPSMYGKDPLLSRPEIKYVQKPFSFDQIAGVVNEILSNPQA